MKHKCKREKLVWEREPSFDGNTVSWKGKCPDCGKEWEQVLTEVDGGLWDIEASMYVNI